MTSPSRAMNVLQAGVRATLRRTLSQDRRTELKRLQVSLRKQLAPILSALHGSFGNQELRLELTRRLPRDFEILMVHTSFDRLLPMYTGTARDLVTMLINFCGPGRTLAMPAFVMGGRNYDASEYFRSRPFDIRRTPSETGLVTEVFRRTPDVLRSLHPTCSICALGPLAKELTSGHHLSRTGLGPGTPFGMMTRRRTIILGLGIEFYRCLTHAHTAAHEMGEAFPLKFESQSTLVTLIDYEGSRSDYTLGLPDRTKKLDLTVLWSVLGPHELEEWRFHGVPLFVVPQAGVITERLIEAARRGITIYGDVRVGNLPVVPGEHLAAEHQTPV